MFQIFMIFLINSIGIAFTAIGLIGNSLGENHPRKARKFALSTIVFGSCLTLILVLVYAISRNKIIHVYTSDEEVIANFERAFWYYIVGVFMILLQALNTGTIRAMGYQKIATYWELISIWLIMIPLVYLFGFPFNYGFRGLWFGVPFGSFFLFGGYIVIIMNAPWKKIAHKASRRYRGESFEQAINPNLSVVS
jgi:Na+-driven multidrug efflux pump